MYTDIKTSMEKSLATNYLKTNKHLQNAFNTYYYL